MNIIVVKSDKLSKNFEPRYVILNKDTGEILDDAQGYGYKSKQKAFAAWTYKNRDKSKDKEKQEKIKRIKQWLREHRDFSNAMETYAFEIAKGSWGPDEKFNTDFVKKLLKTYNYTVDFSAYDLLKVWKNF